MIKWLTDYFGNKNFLINISVLLFFLFLTGACFYIPYKMYFILLSFLFIITLIFVCKRDFIIYNCGLYLNRFKIWHIIILAFLIRILYILFADNTQYSDGFQYEMMTYDICNGKYFFSAHRPTGICLVTAFFYRLFGAHIYVGLIPISVISTAQIYFIYKITENIFNKQCAIFASLLMTFFPEDIIYVNNLITDTWFFFLILLASYIIFCRKTNFINIIIVGIILGIAQYFRSTAFICLFSVIVALIFFKRRLKILKVNYKIIIICTTFILSILPIISYNYRVLKIISISPYQQVWWSFYLSTNTKTIAEYNNEDVLLLLKEAGKRGYPSHINRIVFEDRVALDMAFERINSNVKKYLITNTIKPFVFWGRASTYNFSEKFELSVMAQFVRVGAFLYYKIILILVLMTIFMALRYRDYFWLKSTIVNFFIIYAIIVTMSHIFLEIQGRYHFMFNPLFCILAGGYLYNFRRNL